MLYLLPAQQTACLLPQLPPYSLRFQPHAGHSPSVRLGAAAVAALFVVLVPADCLLTLLNLLFRRGYPRLNVLGGLEVRAMEQDRARN